MNDLNINYPRDVSQTRVFALAIAASSPYRYTPAGEDIIARAAVFEAYLNNGATK